MSGQHPSSSSRLPARHDRRAPRAPVAAVLSALSPALSLAALSLAALSLGALLVASGCASELTEPGLGMDDVPSGFTGVGGGAGGPSVGGPPGSVPRSSDTGLSPPGTPLADCATPGPQ